MSRAYPLRARIAHIMRVLLLSAMLTVGPQESFAQSYTPPEQIVYFSPFLDRPPTDVELASLPSNGRDVIVAKVRLLMPLAWVFDPVRDNQKNAARDLFYTRVDVTDVVKGNARVGDEHDVYFGVPGSDKRYKYPQTRAQIGRSYIVASFSDHDGRRRLMPFPIERRQFEEWKSEVYRDRRERRQ